MEIKTMRYVTTFINRDNHYTVVKDETGSYWAIEARYFAEDGKHLNREINGLLGKRSESLNRTLNFAAFEAEYEYRKNSGKYESAEKALYSMVNFKYPFDD